jgi:hypothetical protein
MWRRFGTPTRRSRSGTGEEFERAYDSFKANGRPKIMFYFRTSAFYTADLQALAQFRKVAEFRRKLEKLGVLYWTYQTPLEFERNVREHLTRRILEIANVLGKERPTKQTLEYREQLPRTKIPLVFLAYSHQDRQAARAIYALLRGSGYPVWMDEQDLLPGQFWHAEVNKAIQQSEVTVLLVSASTTMEKGFWSKELEIILAKSRQKKRHMIIPVRLDQSKPPDALRHIHWIDYFEPDGPDRLVRALEDVTSQPE